MQKEICGLTEKVKKSEECIKELFQELAALRKELGLQQSEPAINMYSDPLAREVHLEENASGKRG